jgi:hypothetical protein
MLSFLSLVLAWIPCIQWMQCLPHLELMHPIPFESLPGHVETPSSILSADADLIYTSQMHESHQQNFDAFSLLYNNGIFYWLESFDR